MHSQALSNSFFPERPIKVSSFDEVILPTLCLYHSFEPCFDVNVYFSARRSVCCTTVAEEFTPEFTAFLPALIAKRRVL